MSEKIGSFTVTANDALSMLSSTKKHYSSIQSCLNGAAPKQSRYGFAGSSREGSVTKILPGVDINYLRAESVRLEKDIRSIERALYSFNNSTYVEFEKETYTISLALKEINDMRDEAHKHYNNMSSSITYNYVEGDDLDGLVDFPSEFESALIAASRRVGLKSAVASKNAEVAVEFSYSSSFVEDMVKTLKQG
jgi:hypothetical protein